MLPHVCKTVTQYKTPCLIETHSFLFVSIFQRKRILGVVTKRYIYVREPPHSRIFIIDRLKDMLVYTTIFAAHDRTYIF